MTANVVQLNIVRMPGKRTASTPKQFKDGVLKRTMSARIMAGLERDDIARALSERTGLNLSAATYKKYEIRTMLPHHLIIAFCEITETDPYMLLTGVPFRIGRHANRDDSPPPFLPKKTAT